MADALKEAFFTIDKDRTDKITMDALEQYRRDNNLDDFFIDRWKKLFDPENTGVITLQTFCDVLGLELAEVQEERVKFVSTVAPSVLPTLPSEILQIAEDMDLQRRLEIFELVKEAEEKNGDNERVCFAFSGPLNFAVYLNILLKMAVLLLRYDLNVNATKT
ncbi:unnamed protein product [Dibothriocephalus latus]|uniref:EF-hand domain-containing protein n=1 Tax=Dibothriocephalus latus TaxID=60516 RepID=A0A3P7NWT2_DIBLA|nr:unnamed protein product [Dibothriocephalus latus]